MRLDAIRIYPVKSGAPVDVGEAVVTGSGLERDRRWMVVTAEGDFLTRRNEGRLARLAVRSDGDGWQLSFDGEDGARLPGQPDPAPRMRVRIWKDDLDADLAAPAASSWLSDRLGRPVHLVYVAEDSLRRVDPAFGHAGDRVGFADGYPLLLVATASVRAVADRVGRPISDRRFRPNLVVATDEPFVEDGWASIRVGDVLFDVAKPCARCVVVDKDPDTAERDAGVLEALGRFRRVQRGVLFGENLIPRSRGRVRKGNPVEVVSERHPERRPFPL